MKGWIATGDAGQNHVGTITEGDLTIIQLQHHGNDGRRLDDLPKSGGHRLAVKEKTVLLRPRFDARRSRCM